jgi:NTP pyrophosphatase (non-canonical NTP hydrolase)
MAGKLKLEDFQVCDKALQSFGVRSQLLKTMEECGELTQAIAKYLQYPDTTDMEHILEETVDVMIMVSQVSRIFHHDKVDAMIAQKITRLKRLIIEETWQDKRPKPVAPASPGRALCQAGKSKTLK